MTLPRWLALFALLRFVPLTHAQAPDAAEKQLRAVLDAKLASKAYVFADE